MGGCFIGCEVESGAVLFGIKSEIFVSRGCGDYY